MQPHATEISKAAHRLLAASTWDHAFVSVLRCSPEEAAQYAMTLVGTVVPIVTEPRQHVVLSRLGPNHPLLPPDTLTMATARSALGLVSLVRIDRDLPWTVWRGAINADLERAA